MNNSFKPKTNKNIKLNKKSWINEIGYMPQTTFLNDETGKIVKIIAKPDTANHTEEILAAWKEVK